MHTIEHEILSLQFCECLIAILLESFDEGVVRGQRSQCTAHMSVNNLQAVDVASVDPSKSRTAC